MKLFGKKFFFVIGFLLAFNIFIYAKPLKCEKITSEMISRQIPVSDFKILSARDMQGVCEIIINVNSRIIPLYGNENYLISGDLFKNKINITKDSIAEFNKKNFLENRKALDELVAFEYKPAEVKSKMTVYMFTEPLCPYCHKAGIEIKNMSDKYGFNVKILLVTMKGEEGRRKCIEAVCRHYKSGEKFNLEEYNKIEWKKDPVEEEFICEKGIELIKRTEELSEKMNVDGVPLFYTNKGDFVSGADMDAMELLIQQN